VSVLVASPRPATTSCFSKCGLLLAWCKTIVYQIGPSGMTENRRMTTGKKKKPSAQEDLNEILSDFLQFYIFLLLREGPIHGYGLMKAFKQRTGKGLSAGTLYPFLQKLEHRGPIKQSDESVGRRPKIVYSLTRKGKTFCNRLFERFAAITASALEPNLQTCASCGVKVYGGHHEVIGGQTLAFCCSHCAAAYKRELQE